MFCSLPRLFFHCKLTQPCHFVPLQSAQLEVTLIVLLRLGEDVFIPLDSHIQTQRRKSIEQGLNEKMNDIFSFFIKALQENVGAWRRSVS